MFPLILLAWVPALVGAPCGPRDADEAQLLAELQALSDQAPPARIAELGALGTPEACSALLVVYGDMESLYMRREVLRAIAPFVHRPGTADVALGALLEVLRTSLSPELRQVAFDAIAAAPGGRAALAELARSEADPTVRVEALRRFSAGATADDADFLRGLCGAEAETDPELAGLAFEGALPWLEQGELVQATKHPLQAVRSSALKELWKLDARQAASIAEKVYRTRDAPPSERVIAMRVWLEAKGGRIYKRLLDDATSVAMPETIAFAIADELGALEDPALDRMLLSRLRQKGERGRRVILRAARHVEDASVGKAFVAALDAQDPRLVREAIAGVRERGDRAAKEPLYRLLDRTDDPTSAALAVGALDALQAGQSAWEERLFELPADERAPVRNAALGLIAGRDPTRAEPLLIAALQHADWSTRLAAARGLERLRTPGSVGALCRRVAFEEGRMLEELSEILWRLTGQHHGTNARVWGRWWSDVQASFQVISREELALRELEREERRLWHTTRAMLIGRGGVARFLEELEDEGEAFFGLQVVSHEVIFAIDVSMSMEEPLRVRLQEGSIRTRLDLARRELRRILGLLEPSTRFNLITFCGEVRAWSPEPELATPENVALARDFIDGLTVADQTNFYDPLRIAFATGRTDTLYLLSDGEPTSGALQEASALRSIVAEWNLHRGIKIHCIAVGEDLGLLRGLAEDSGGAYAIYR